MNGKEFENLVEDILIKHNKTYDREGTRISYGHKASKGKYDFKLKNTAIECKCIKKLGLLTLPGFNEKTGKPYVAPKIKPHQLRHLREFKGTGYLLIHDSTNKLTYALTMQEFDEYILEYNLPRSMKYIDDYQVDLEEFLKGVS